MSTGEGGSISGNKAAGLEADFLPLRSVEFKTEWIIIATN
jgi:hypothetical protein